METTIDARIRALETTFEDWLRIVEESLQEAYNKLDMILERYDTDNTSSPSKTF